MSGRFSISPQAYDFLLDGISRQFTQEKPGQTGDIAFIQNDFWLQDTAVIELVDRHKGLWRVWLLFVHHNNPFKFIRRRITAYADNKRALTAAHYMRRQAAKDQRGTLVLNTGLIDYCNS